MTYNVFSGTLNHTHSLILTQEKKKKEKRRKKIEETTG